MNFLFKNSSLQNNLRDKIAIISIENNVLTLINIFRVEPCNQQKIIDFLIHASKNKVIYAKGFISSTLHRSLDGKKISVYTQWSSLEDYLNMKKDPGLSTYFEKAEKDAKFDDTMYEVAAVFCPKKDK